MKRPSFATAISLLALGIALVGQTHAAININALPVCAKWTPQLNFGGAHAGMAPSGTFPPGGNICVWGPLFFVEGDYTLQTKGSSTGVVTMDGFPFSTLNDMGAGFFFPPVVANVATSAAGVYLEGGMVAGTSSWIVTKIRASDGAEIQLTDADATNTSYFKMSGVGIRN